MTTNADGPPGDGQDPPLHLAVFVRNAAWFHPLPENGQITIGRARDNDLRINDPAASRHHAVLEVGAGLRVKRVSRTNRLYVGDAARAVAQTALARGRQEVVESVELGLGDAIYIGSSVIEVRLGSPAGPHDSGAETVDTGRVPGRAELEDMVEPPSLRDLYQQAYRFAASPIPLHVVLVGEAGVGKEVLAVAMHRRSPRAGGPFVRLRCGVQLEKNVESELFGYEKGAYPDAISARPGLLEQASGGTLFLDDVEALPESLQGRLCCALDEQKVFRIGGATPRIVDVRVIAATRRDLKADVERGAFREDLSGSLHGMTFVLPPLRKRLPDVAPLAAAFLAMAARRSGRTPVPVLSPEALSTLEAQRWSGNLRELRTVIERALALCPDAIVQREHLCLDAPVDVPPPPPTIPPPSAAGPVHVLAASTLRDVHRAARDENLPPEALRERIDPKLVSTLVTEPDRAQQLWSDLAALDQLGWLQDGTVPLALWLRNAARLAGATPAGEVFEGARRELAGTLAALRLPTPSMNAVREAALYLGLERKALLAGIDSGLTRTIPVRPDPASQMATDLEALERAGLVAYTLPLQVWLDTARTLTQNRVQGLVFEQASLNLRHSLR